MLPFKSKQTHLVGFVLQLRFELKNLKLFSVRVVVAATVIMTMMITEITAKKKKTKPPLTLDPKAFAR